MKSLIILFSISFLLFGCAQRNDLSQNLNPIISKKSDTDINTQYSSDSSKIAILKINSSFKNSTNTQLTEQELKKIEYFLEISLKQYNDNLSPSSSRYIELSKYKRQYVPHINSKGEKIVWIQCFSAEIAGDYWKTDILEISDGGSSVFEVEINLTDNTCGHIGIHGYA